MRDSSGKSDDRFPALSRLPGVLVVPTVGGQDEPEARYQTNEITQQVAAKVGGSPVFL